MLFFRAHLIRSRPVYSLICLE